MKVAKSCAAQHLRSRALVRWHLGQNRTENRSECKYVAAFVLIVDFSECLLGRHVRRGPEHRSDSRHVVASASSARRNTRLLVRVLYGFRTVLEASVGVLGDSGP